MSSNPLAAIAHSISESWDYLWTKEGFEDFSLSTAESFVIAPAFHYLSQFGPLKPLGTVISGLSLLFSAQTGWDFLQGKGSKAMLARFLGDSFGGALYGGLYKSAVHFVTKNKMDWENINLHFTPITPKPEPESPKLASYTSVENFQHRETNQRNITTLAGPLLSGGFDPNRRFLILGGGIIHEQPDVDYPLEAFARAGRTIIVDYHQGGLLGAMKLLPHTLNGNIKGFADDITEVMIDMFEREVVTILSTSQTPDEARRRYCEWLHSCRPRSPDWASKYAEDKVPDLVVSSMVLNQLYPNSIGLMREGFNTRFPSVKLYDEATHQAEKMFIGRLLEAHISSLRALVQRGSTVYLSSDVLFRMGNDTGVFLFKPDGDYVINLKDLVPGSRLQNFEPWFRAGTHNSENRIQAIGILPKSPTLS